MTEATRTTAYGAYANDPAILNNSSSGGIFMLLAVRVIEEGGVVVGAAMDDDCLGVSHVIIDRVELLSKLSGTKYIQSQLNEIFTKVKTILDSGRKVLFSGTPCQISALNNFLTIPYGNLLRVDLFCHGVPSSSIWKKYAQFLKYKHGEDILSVNFRNKKYSWCDYSIRIVLNNRIINDPAGFNPYMRLFLNDYTLMPACYHCHQKGVSRNSDITLADFWGVTNILPSLYNKAGTSLILAHTDIGRRYVLSLNVTLAETDAHSAVKYNPSAIRSALKPQAYDIFTEDLQHTPFDKLADRYCPITFRSRIRYILVKTNIMEVFRRINCLMTRLRLNP